MSGHPFNDLVKNNINFVSNRIKTIFVCYKLSLIIDEKTVLLKINLMSSVINTRFR